MKKVKDKIRIYFNQAAAEQFVIEIESVRRDANFLIETFNLSQSFKTIMTETEFLELCTDPVSYYDQILMTNISLPQKNGLTANIQKLAELYSIPRPSYLLSLGIDPDTVDNDPECTTCRKPEKVHIKKTRPVISIYIYQDNAKYLSFSFGKFELNQKSITEAEKQFSVFADTPARIEIVNFWQSVCDTLNQYHDKYHIGNEDKRLIAKALKLQQSEGVEGKFVVNPQALSFEISKY